eukprot:jgi/Orpsp1_1/1191509/evm.model.d7180000086464.1
MKLNLSLLFLGVIAVASAFPQNGKNPYLRCNDKNNACKLKQLMKCEHNLNNCLRKKNKGTQCDEIRKLCEEIMNPKMGYFDDSSSEDSEEIEELNTFKPTKENVKYIGRANYEQDYLWIGLTDAGIEYKFKGKTTTIKVTADTTSYGEENPARIKIFADGADYIDTIITEKISNFTVNFNNNKEHTVKFIKLSEAERGSIRINEIKTDAKKITPAPQAAKKIEFIGDSITCAYGVDVDASIDGQFSSRTEDGTKSYAYKTAQKFHADYSMVSYSGFAILSCFAFTGERFTEAALPQYYDKLGYSFEPNVFDDGTYQLQNTLWNQQDFIPDLVVINLGTNDNSYFGSIDESKVPEEKLAFIEEYEKFLAQIREVYPKAEILCVLGMMGQEVFQEIEQAVEGYSAKTGDTHVKTFLMNVQNSDANGLGIDGHPSAQSHVDATYELVGEIERLYGWKSDPTVNIEL